MTEQNNIIFTFNTETNVMGKLRPVTVTYKRERSDRVRRLNYMRRQEFCATPIDVNFDNISVLGHLNEEEATEVSRRCRDDMRSRRFPKQKRRGWKAA